MTMLRLVPSGALKRILLCAAVAAAASAGTSTAWADPAAAGAVAGSDDTRQELMERGFAELKRGDLEAARLAFATVWARRPEVVVGLSLAEIEMRLGRFVEAAEHWQYLTTNLPSTSSDQRDAAREQLNLCRSHIGSLTLQVAPAGAMVVLDDKPLGEAPLGRELFLEPGVHTVYALGGANRSEPRTFEISAGSRLSFSFTVAAVPVNASAPQPVGPVSMDDAPARPIVNTHDESVREPLLIAGGIAAVTSAAVGTYFAIRSRGASHDADSARAAAEAASDPSVPRNSVCFGVERSPSCAALASSADDARHFQKLSLGAFIAGGVIGAATIAGVVFWKGPDDGHAGASLGITVAPWLGSARGVEVSGRF